MTVLPFRSGLLRFASRSALVWFALAASQTNVRAAESLPPLSSRFATGDVDEVPDFQRHIGPLLGHLGCNGRACHGSFQGRGGFALSLFGYDFAADHSALTDPDTGRVDPDDVEESLILFKPIDADRHEGGQLLDRHGWEYRVLQRWIGGGAAFSGELHQLDRLEVTPIEIVFDEAGEAVPLRVIAHWEDGTREDVTELCRFTTNDDSVATISATGQVDSIGAGDTHVVIAYDSAVVAVPVLRPASVDLHDVSPARPSDHPIDLLVAEKLNKLRIVPSAICDDSDFIRRVSLDLTGMLPEAAQVERFVADPSPDKREQFIEACLSAPSYAAWWATRLSDWTGNNEAKLNNALPVRGLASKLWFGWLRQRLADNVPYDEIVAGIVAAESRLPDESYLEYCQTMSEICRSEDIESYADRPGLSVFWSRNNFRTPEERAIGFAYSFLGVRVECAQCHKHPFDRWSKDDFDGFAQLFAPIRATPTSYSRDALPTVRQLTAAITDGEELRGGPLRLKMTQALRQGEVIPFPELVVASQQPQRRRNPRFRNITPPKVGRILGEADLVEIQGDPRTGLMDWLRHPDNPYFAKAIVNRVWANHFGIGIVNPIDDLNLGNPPSNGPLFDYLAAGFIESGFDLHWLHRQILTSDAYQRSSDANASNAADTRNFSRHVPRRLPAEVLRDSIRLVTAGAADEAVARRELTSLAISGDLATVRRGRGDFALQVFGQSTRESNCDCDRSDQSNLLQSLYLQNDFDIHQALRQPGGWVDEATADWPVARRGAAGESLPPRGLRTRRPETARGAVEGAAMRPAMESTGETISEAVLEQRMRRQAAFRVRRYLQLSEQRQAEMLPRLRREIAQLNRRLVQAGRPPLRFNELLRQQRTLLAAADDSVPPGNDRDRTTEATTASVDVEPAAIESVIRQAYLRALCRHPVADELKIAVDFVRESSDPVDGVRSVVWALLNTKEFLLTH